MSNKTDIEEDIKILENYLEQQDRKFVNEYRLKFLQAMENILSDRERLEKENKKLNTEIAEHVYFESTPKDKLNSLSEECSKLTKEINWTKEDTDRVIKEYREMENKANKYDSLIKEIKAIRDKLEVEDYYCSREAIEDLNKILGREGE